MFSVKFVVVVVVVLQLCHGFQLNFHRQKMSPLASTRIADGASKIVSKQFAWELDTAAMLEVSF